MNITNVNPWSASNKPNCPECVSTMDPLDRSTLTRGACLLASAMKHGVCTVNYGAPYQLSKSHDLQLNQKEQFAVSDQPTACLARIFEHTNSFIKGCNREELVLCVSFCFEQRAHDSKLLSVQVCSTKDSVCTSC